MANQQLTGLDYKIQEMAGRIRELREISGFTPAEMAGKTGVSIEEYLLCEAGGSNLTFAFLYRCALAFGVDVTDLIEGQSPKLRSYTLTRAGKGQKIEQASRKRRPLCGCSGRRWVFICLGFTCRASGSGGASRRPGRGWRCSWRTGWSDRWS